MGFGTTLLKDIPTHRFELFLPPSIVLMTEIILITLTIMYSVSAYRVKGYPYFYTMTNAQFVDDEQNLNKEIIH